MSITIAALLLIAIIGYLWGSIPTGYWMGKLLRGKDFDVRAYGSHRTGATNVRRSLGNLPALIVLLVDLSKGVGPALIAMLVPFFFNAGWGPTVGALAALLGHNYPIFIGFRGGRGVSTGAGATLVISPFAFLVGLLVTAGTIAISRFVSLGSIAGGVAIMLCGVLLHFVGPRHSPLIGYVGLPQLVYLLAGPLLVIISHYDNIGRLLAGTERKLGEPVASNP